MRRPYSAHPGFTRANVPDATAIYLDHAASTPTRPEVCEAMLPWLGGYPGNPTSLHRPGRDARRAVDRAREQVAALIHAEPREIIFTSGGTEANNLALRGMLKTSGHLLTTAIEHHSVLHTAEALQKQNSIRLTLAPANADGRVEFPADAIPDNTALVSVMHANNETGVIQPIEPIAAACRDRGIPFHTDAIQSAAHLPIDVTQTPLDLISLSGHKLGAPKGIGALYCRHGIDLTPQQTGGPQERGHRPGTENLPGIAGFGVACELAQKEMETESARLAQLRDQLEQALLEKFPNAWRNGAAENRLPHIANLGFPHAEGEAVMMTLDAVGIAVSTGSACTSGALDPSHVLLAMGQTHEQAHAAVRFSFGKGNKAEDVERVVTALE